jgi:hypothetical protein
MRKEAMPAICYAPKLITEPKTSPYLEYICFLSAGPSAFPLALACASASPAPCLRRPGPPPAPHVYVPLFPAAEANPETGPIPPPGHYDWSGPEPQKLLIPEVPEDSPMGVMDLGKIFRCENAQGYWSGDAVALYRR